MNAYETVIVIDPAVDEAGVEKELEKVSELVKRNNGRIANVERWGRRKMTYPIKHRHEGTYVCIQFFADAGAPRDLTRMIQLDDSILRHLVIKGHVQTAVPPPVAVVPPAAAKDTEAPAEPAPQAA